MLIHELASEECRTILGRNGLARLACTRGDQPYVVPVLCSFDVERNCLYGFSAVGQKVEWMRENPKVCVELEDIADRTHWTTVLVFGRYEEILDTDEDRETRDRAQKLLEERREWWLPAIAKTPSHEHQAVVVYRIRIDRMTGRRAALSPKLVSGT